MFDLKSFDLKKLKNSKKELGIILGTSAIWIGLVGVVFYMSGSVPSIGSKYIYTVKATRPVSAGNVIKETDLKLVKDSVYNYVQTSYSSVSPIVGKIATRNIYKNENIKQDDISPNSSSLRPCTLPVSLSNLSDSSISPGDYVDVIANYKDKGRKPDIIVSKALVKKVVDSTGKEISEQQSSDQNQLPAFLTIMVSSNSIMYVEDAKKTVSFDFYKYPSSATAQSKVTYTPSWDNQTSQAAASVKNK